MPARKHYSSLCQPHPGSAWEVGWAVPLVWERGHVPLSRVHVGQKPRQAPWAPNLVLSFWEQDDVCDLHAVGFGEGKELRRGSVTLGMSQMFPEHRPQGHHVDTEEMPTGLTTPSWATDSTVSET